MSIRQAAKGRLTNYIKQKAFYQSVAQQNQRLMDLHHTTVQSLKKVRKELKANEKILNYPWFIEPGHYYSPLVDKKQVSFKGLLDIEIARTNQKETVLPGIKVDKRAQQTLLTDLAKHAKDIPDYNHAGELRYKYDNDQFGRMDAGVLWVMLRQYQPRHIIEVGSGWTSALMLDVNERFPATAAQLTFVEPYPDRLYATLKPGDKKHCDILTKPVQKLPLTEFQALQKDDILFIDNSHVSKYGSDVNYLFLHVLPSLKPGVIIHVHDIFYPFEYPRQWVERENRNWNEVYVLHALLIGSDMFEILLWPSYLKVVDQQKFETLLPTATGHGGSIWLRKLR